MSLLPGSGPSLSLKRSLSCILARKSEASDWAWSMQQGARMMGKCFQWETWQDKLQLTGTCKDRKGKTNEIGLWNSCSHRLGWTKIIILSLNYHFVLSFYYHVLLNIIFFSFGIIILLSWFLSLSFFFHVVSSFCYHLFHDHFLFIWEYRFLISYWPLSPSFANNNSKQHISGVPYCIKYISLTDIIFICESPA